MRAISSYRGNRPHKKNTHTPTDRGDYNTLRRNFANAQCKKSRLVLERKTSRGLY